MAKTQVSCPRCRQPVVVELDQLFDLNTDPRAKQRFLSGEANVVRCQVCGHEGSLPVPLVYHDPEKELLLTYFPPELGLPVNEQERMIGPLLNQVMNRLPNEKKKAYLLRPQTMLTFQLMLEKVLEADGITREVIQAQQQRMNLLQRLLSISPELRSEVIAQEKANIDETFFVLMSRLAEAATAQGDQQSAKLLADLQEQLIKETEVGQKLASQALEVQAAVKSLQEAGQNGLTREALVDLIIAAPNEIRLTTLVSMARQGLDYTFFQLLSDRIDEAQGEEKQKLLDLREKLLEMVQEIDQAAQKEVDQARDLLEKILRAPDIKTALQENAESLDESFVEVLKVELEKAQQKSDLSRIAKLQELVGIFQELASPPPEIEFAQKLVSAANDDERRKLLEDNAAMVTQEFIQLLGSLASQSESQGQSKEVVESLRDAYRSALKFSMESKLRSN